MVIMAGAVFYSIRLALAAFPAIALRYPIKKWAAVGAILGALGYLLISGASFATVRSYIMISIMFLAVLLDRPAVALRNVALAALGILVVWPESLLDAGFQMSFAAVGGLVAVFEMLRQRREAQGPDGARPLFGVVGTFGAFVGGIVLSTLIASVTVAPFSIYHFHNSQQFAILANVIAIPICNVLVMPAALATLIAMPVGLEALPLAVMGYGIEAMAICARWVAALPGAVVRIPAIPQSAFLLFVAGGLWLVIWRTRLRALGLLPVLAGLALAPTLVAPDVLVGRDGSLIAARAGDGRLSALAVRGSQFELGRWLEADGDSRPVADAAKASVFTCDAIGCRAQVKGRVLAVSRAPATLADDCGVADVLVATVPRPAGCTRPLAVIDPPALRRLGTHALKMSADGIAITTVAAARGERPWSMRATGFGRTAARDADNTVGAAGVAPRFEAPRPEDEDGARRPQDVP